MQRATVPFASKRYGANYTEEVTTTGVMRLDGQHLVLELRDESLHYLSLARERGEVETFMIPLAQIDGITVSRNWPWGARVTIRTRTLEVLGNLPMAKGNECILHIRRRDHEKARELAIGVSLHLANEAMRRLEEAQ